MRAEGYPIPDFRRRNPSFRLRGLPARARRVSLRVRPGIYPSPGREIGRRGPPGAVSAGVNPLGPLDPLAGFGKGIRIKLRPGCLYRRTIDRFERRN